MSASRPVALVRSWIGLAAGLITLCLAAWLTGEYIHAAWVTPADTARVESLKEKARTDATIHPELLQPEFDRQREALQRRLTVYRWGGLTLLICLGVSLAWMKWLKPGPGEWAGVPPWLLKRIGAAPERREPVVPLAKRRPARKPIKVDPATVPLRGLSKSQKALYRFRVLDTCSGCTLCAQVCPVGAIEARPYLLHEVIDERCTRCGLCVPVCPENAIEVIGGTGGAGN
jgi:ferredoxin